MNFKPAYTLFLKVGPACNAGCRSCPSGRKLPGDVEQIPLMRPEFLARALDTVLAQGNIISCVLHYYSEPTLSPHISGIARVCKERGIRTVMSTNGSRPEKLRECYEEGIDNLIFSVSGWSQAVHERSHKGIDIEILRGSMAEIANLRDARFPKNYIKCGWHDYAYNRHEAPAMRQFCEDYGIHFDPYQTSVLPINIVTKRFYELPGNFPELDAERDLFTKLPEARMLCQDRKHWRCGYQDGMFAIDGNGMVSLCPADIASEGNPNTMGSIFDKPLSYYNEIRRSDPWCVRCKAVGAHVYSQQRHLTPLGLKTEIRRTAEDAYRALGIGARFPWISKVLGELFYERPKNGDK